MAPDIGVVITERIAVGGCLIGPHEVSGVVCAASRTTGRTVDSLKGVPAEMLVQRICEAGQ